MLVDNKAIKTIYYKKQSGITKSEEIELAYKVGEIIDVDYSKLSTYRLKNFWYVNNYDLARSRITDKEWKKCGKHCKYSSSDSQRCDGRRTDAACFGKRYQAGRKGWTDL